MRDVRRGLLAGRFPLCCMLLTLLATLRASFRVCRACFCTLLPRVPVCYWPHHWWCGCRPRAVPRPAAFARLDGVLVVLLGWCVCPRPSALLSVGSVRRVLGFGFVGGWLRLHLVCGGILGMGRLPSSRAGAGGWPGTIAGVLVSLAARLRPIELLAMSRAASSFASRCSDPGRCGCCCATAGSTEDGWRCANRRSSRRSRRCAIPSLLVAAHATAAATRSCCCHPGGGGRVRFGCRSMRCSS